MKNTIHALEYVISVLKWKKSELESFKTRFYSPEKFWWLQTVVATLETTIGWLWPSVRSPKPNLVWCRMVSCSAGLLTFWNFWNSGTFQVPGFFFFFSKWNSGTFLVSGLAFLWICVSFRYAYGPCKKEVNSTRSSQEVSHPGTILAQCCLTAVIGWELVFSTWYGRWQEREPLSWLKSAKKTKTEKQCLKIWLSFFLTANRK